MTDLVPVDGSVVLFLLVRRPDGTPTGYPMTAVFRDGVLEFSTYRKAAKSRYLLADDRVCCVIPDPEVPGRGVALYGRAHPTDGSAFAAGTEAGEARPMEVPAEVREKVRDRVESDKRLVFRVEVERRTEIERGADAQG